MSRTKLDDLWDRIKGKPLRVEGTLKNGKFISARNISSVELNTKGNTPTIVFRSAPLFSHPIVGTDRFLDINEKELVDVAEQGRMLFVQCKEKEVRIYLDPPQNERDVRLFNFEVCPRLT